MSSIQMAYWTHSDHTNIRLTQYSDPHYTTTIHYKTVRSQASFVGDAPRLWNKAPSTITAARSLNIAKKEIRKFCKILPRN